jgi:hypothetical protein
MRTNGIAEHAVAQVADVRRFVRVDVRVFDDDFRRLVGAENDLGGFAGGRRDEAL